MNMFANWSYPNEIRFGSGRIAEIAEACVTAGLRNPLLITDQTLADHEIVSRTLAVLEKSGLGWAMFSDVGPNPSHEDLTAGISALRAGAHDGVIAFGGGSALDLGKLAAFMVGQSRPVWDFEDIADWWTRANSDTILPVVAVPTTAGTGSEVGRAAVLTDRTLPAKKIIFHPKMLPAVVVADPELTVGLPPALTAGTGMDAFAHCLEAYCSPHFHPMSQGIALEGVRLVTEFLPRAFEDGTDLDARGGMMAAAIMGAVAFQKGLGAIHAVSHPVGAHYGLHHGMTNAVVMPMVLDLNRPAIEDRLADMAAYLGISGGYEGFRSFVMELRLRLGVPDSLRQMGVDDEKLDLLVTDALCDPSCGGNPIKLDKENMRELIEACLM